jgi:hypothetical protein
LTANMQEYQRSAMTFFGGTKVPFLHRDAGQRALDNLQADRILIGLLRGDFDTELALDAPEQFARAAGSNSGVKLTANPIRWLAAALLAVLVPMNWMKWIAEAQHGGREEVIRKLTIEEPPGTIGEVIHPILYPLAGEARGATQRLSEWLVLAVVVIFLAAGIFWPTIR